MNCTIFGCFKPLHYYLVQYSVLKKGVSMKFYKLFLFSIILLLPVAFIVFSSKPLDINTEKPLTLNIWVQESLTQEELYFDKAIKRFESYNPSIKIGLSFIEGSDLKVSNYINTSLLNQSYPDIIISSSHNFNSLATEGLLYNLNDYIKTYEENYFFDSILKNAIYNNNLYGVSYDINPEVLVYRKDFLASINIDFPKGFNNIDELKNYLNSINELYSTDNLDKIPFSIPTIISDGEFILSLLNIKNSDYNSLLTSTLSTLRDMYTIFDINYYDYDKTGAHPFFLGKSALAIEPLSLIYSSIERDNNLKNKIGIVPIKNFDMKFSYSNNKYISILNKSNNISASLDFLNFFLNSSEIWQRYRYLNTPIITTTLTEQFINDKSFDNATILDYVKESFTYPVSPNIYNELDNLDSTYDIKLNN